MKKIYAILIFLALGIFIVACSSDETTNPMTDTCEGIDASFSNDIFPIITTRCANDIACHSAGSGQPNFVDYQSVKDFVDNGLIEEQVVDTRLMPQGSSLTQMQIDLFDCWIADGAPNN